MSMMVDLRAYPLAYLGTPYSNYQGGIEVAFRDAAALAAKLLLAGVKVYSPIAHCHPIAIHGGLDPMDYRIWLPFNQTMLRLARVLVVAHLNGWQSSRGLKEEVEYFADVQRPVFDCDPVTLCMVRRQDALRAAF